MSFIVWKSLNAGNSPLPLDIKGYRIERNAFYEKIDNNEFKYPRFADTFLVISNKT